MRKIFTLVLTLLITATAWGGRADRKMNKQEKRNCQNYEKWLNSLQNSFEKRDPAWLKKEMARYKNNPERLAYLTDIQKFINDNVKVLPEYKKTVKESAKLNTYRGYYAATLVNMKRDILSRQLDLLKHLYYRSGTLQYRAGLCSRYNKDPKKLKLAREILDLEIDRWNVEIDYREKIIENRKQSLRSYKDRGLRIPDIEDVLFKR